MTTLHLRKSIDQSPLRLVFFLILLAVVWAALSPTTQAADGGLPNNNTAEGTNALNSLTTGKSNTAIGESALFSNTSGNNNTATGVNALLHNNGTGIGGTNNTATGLNALNRNTTGSANTATGAGALFFNDGDNNTADGFEALEKNTIGTDDTAIGEDALFNNMNGQSNTAVGADALLKNTGGGSNTAVGAGALSNSTGNENIAVGDSAGENVTTGSNNIDIGNMGVALDAFTMRLGAAQNATYIAGISGATVPGGVGVIIDSTGHLGTMKSSARFKEAIKPMDKASEAILALKPVTFRYKQDLDPDLVPQFGLVAEEVEKVNPDLVARDAEGKPYTVRYEAVNAMLLNEFLKEHRKVQDLEKQVAALTAGLQRVTAELETRQVASGIAISQK